MRLAVTLLIIGALTVWAIAGFMHVLDSEDPTHFYE